MNVCHLSAKTPATQSGESLELISRTAERSARDQAERELRGAGIVTPGMSQSQS